MSGKRIILFLVCLSLLPLTSGLAVTYTCKKFGKTFTVDMGSSTSKGYSAITSSCQTLIDRHWKAFGMEKKYWDCWNLSPRGPSQKERSQCQQ